jgi:hypothetical protein
MPPLDPGATGHVIYLDPDRKGVSEYVHTERLGAVPSLKEGEVVRALEVGEVVDNPNICSGQASPFRNGKAVVRYLFQWRFDALLEQVDGFPTYNRRKATLVRPPDRWSVIVDDAMLDLTIPEIAGRCWRLVSMVPRSGIVIREFRVGPRSATFDLDWGNADSALIDFAGLIGGGVLARTDDRITFPRQAESDSDDVPTYALVVLYRNEHIVAAQYGLYGP